MDIHCSISFRAALGHEVGPVREEFVEAIRDYRELVSRYTLRMRSMLHTGNLGSIQLFMDGGQLLEVPWNDVREWHRSTKRLGVENPRTQLRFFLTYARSFRERLSPEPLQPDEEFG
jgi:hypothetical protein